MELLRIDILTDGGPWADHNYPCPVYREEHAVLDLSTDTFHPSWKAQSEGYMIVKIERLWARRLLKWLLRI